MYLKAVEIDGFKSFGEKVYIDFNRGITSIVGPNGSGKSNILDAVLWVLGEQSYKNIRAKESQDVIFSGGKEKKAMNKAEVSLYIDNQDRYLDLDEDIVKITRKININGENEYLINDTKSRLKDIGSLFLDTGIGKTAYSVIGQGKVERIINSSPKEVKNIIEEAAGIKKFQANKQESMRNLINIENELEKVEIILNETRENKNKIEKQAEFAQKFLDLREERNSLAKAIYLNELTLKENEVNDISQNKVKVSEEAKILNEKLEKTKNRLNFIDLEKEEVRKEIALISSRNNELRNIIATKQQERAVTTEKIENLKKDKKSNLEFQEILSNKILNKESEIRDNLSIKESLEKNILSMEKENEEYEKNINSLKVEKEKIELSFENKNEKRRDLELKKLNVINDIEIANKRIASSQSDIDNFKIDLKNLEEKYFKNTEENNSLIKLKSQKEKELEEIEARNEFLENQLSEISKKINKVIEGIRDLEYNEKTYSGKLEALVRMQENNEGFFKGVKEVLNSNIKGIEGVLISLIDVDAELEKAIEASVSGSLQDIVVKNKEVAKEAIKFLNDNKLGRASFLALDIIKPNKKEFKLKIDGVLGVAADLIRADEKYKKVIDFVFGNLLIVKNIDIAINIVNNNLFSGNVVTLSGELLSSRGRITGGENQKSNISQILERKKEISILEENLTTLRDRIKKNIQEREDLTNLLEKYENEIDKIDSLEENARKQLNIYKEELTILNDKNERLSREIIILKDNIESEERYRKEFSNKITNSSDEKEKIDNMIALLNKEIEEAREELQRCSYNIDELNGKFADIRILYMNNKDKVLQLEESIKKYQKEKEELEFEKDKNLKKMKDLEESISNYEDLEEKLLDEIEKDTKTYNTENKDIEKLSSREILLTDEERYLLKEKSNLETETLKINDKLEKLSENLKKINQDIENINENLSSLENVSTQNIKIENIKSSKDYLRTLDTKIANFGDVNLLAIEEFKELKVKYEFISNQRDDIVKGRKTLLDLIQEIDETIHSRFYDTYNEINANFNKMCNETIKNTEGKLNLMNEDDFENCGIEIFVKFKNKKKQPLSLLSGGEKSMVAIAFIMAIFMYKPSPFTFLDEIEAALDEKNTKNLLDKLREFTDKSQFILITHNKDTMKESDSIFGVTMNKEIGISKVVPVKF